MSKVIDFLFSNNWEEFQRIRLYKKVGKAMPENSLDFEKKSKISKFFEKEINELFKKK